MLSRRLLVVIGLTAIALVAATWSSGGHDSPVLAQEGAGWQHADHLPLPVTIDGALTPSKVPDLMAYYHFLGSISAPRGAPSAVIARRDAFVAKTGLSEVDQAVLLESTEGFQDALALITAEGNRVAAESSGVALDVAFAELKARRDALTADARGRLERDLSPAGLQRLDVYIETQVKPRIVVFGDPYQ